MAGRSSVRGVMRFFTHIVYFSSIISKVWVWRPELIRKLSCCAGAGERQMRKAMASAPEAGWQQAAAGGAAGAGRQGGRRI
ncbi:hypothetical protein PVAP13_3KG173327 [Panicum virgatum]|uniref:Uncharacterized protein n=1 Tax=Panicum virgatum TaxID=38727 RepID=A0A8T0UXG6_PANVG|nr:hypothetical protein PVAP13_3KG173327 [Panicum virgatum]